MLSVICAESSNKSFMLSAIMLNVVVLSVIMLNVVAPFLNLIVLRIFGHFFLLKKDIKIGQWNSTLQKM